METKTIQLNIQYNEEGEIIKIYVGKTKQKELTKILKYIRGY